MGHEVTLTKATRDGGKDILAGIKTEMGISFVSLRQSAIVQIAP